VPNISPEVPAERLYTFRAAAEALGLPYYKIQRAAKAGLVPTYSLLNGRRYLKLTDIMLATRDSGADAKPLGEPGGL
jgi:hypothetical protein